MNEEDIKYRQGRSQRQNNSNEMIRMYAFVGIVFILIAIMIYNIFS